jgi:hypothetical protein
MVLICESRIPLRRTRPELNMLRVTTALNRLSDCAAFNVYPPPPEMPSAPGRWAFDVGAAGDEVRHAADIVGAEEGLVDPARFALSRTLVCGVCRDCDVALLRER